VSLGEFRAAVIPNTVQNECVWIKWQNDTDMGEMAVLREGLSQSIKFVLKRVLVFLLEFIDFTVGDISRHTTQVFYSKQFSLAVLFAQQAAVTRTESCALRRVITQCYGCASLQLLLCIASCYNTMLRLCVSTTVTVSFLGPCIFF
jgi:hypothetical protein